MQHFVPLEASISTDDYRKKTQSGRLFGSDRGLAIQVFYSVLNSLEPLTHLGNRQILNSCLTENKLRLPY
jgi:hypothetical protein